jgi:hypothetical protein
VKCGQNNFGCDKNRRKNPKIPPFNPPEEAANVRSALNSAEDTNHGLNSALKSKAGDCKTDVQALMWWI